MIIPEAHLLRPPYFDGNGTWHMFHIAVIKILGPKTAWTNDLI